MEKAVPGTAGICAQVEIHMYPSQSGNPTKILHAKSEGARPIWNFLQSNAKDEQCCLPCMYRHCNGVTQPFCLGAVSWGALSRSCWHHMEPFPCMVPLLSQLWHWWDVWDAQPGSRPGLLLGQAEYLQPWGIISVTNPP